MTKNTPRLCIGLPVYNGERYIQEALDSILGQTFSEFELIISDNASTDLTYAICADYAARDGRIHLLRNEQNLGAARNYNRVFELSRGEYFKWAAHDDIIAPSFLEKCIAVLDGEPSIILCHTRAARIDENSDQVGVYASKMKTDFPTPSERFHDLILVRHPCTAIFGVVRRDVLTMTNLIGNYVGSDRNLLAELGLLGCIYEIPENLFYRRDHAQASIAKFDIYNRLNWFDPKKARQVHLPNWRRGVEYLRSVTRAKILWSEKLRCYRYIAFWSKRERKKLARDIEMAGRTIFPFSTRN